jgi:hypothetical protein
MTIKIKLTATSAEARKQLTGLRNNFFKAVDESQQQTTGAPGWNIAVRDVEGKDANLAGYIATFTGDEIVFDKTAEPIELLKASAEKIVADLVVLTGYTYPVYISQRALTKGN